MPFPLDIVPNLSPSLPTYPGQLGLLPTHTSVPLAAPWAGSATPTPMIPPFGFAQAGGPRFIPAGINASRPQVPPLSAPALVPWYQLLVLAPAAPPHPTLGIGLPSIPQFATPPVVPATALSQPATTHSGSFGEEPPNLSGTRSSLTLSFQSAASGRSEGHRQLIVNFLDPTVTNADLHAAFTTIGPVDAARVIYDPQTGASKGYGFVYFKRSSDAATAMQCMTGLPLGSKRIKVSYANPQKRGKRGGKTTLPAKRTATAPTAATCAEDLSPLMSRSETSDIHATKQSSPRDDNASG
jgi:hypothetical protein